MNPWIDHATDEARKQVKAVIKHCRLAIGNADNGPEAYYLLARSVKSLPGDNFRVAISDYMGASSLAGAYVAQRRIEKKRGKRAAATGEFSAFGKPFNEAIDALSERLKLSPDAFRALESAARSRAGAIAGQFNLRVVEDVYAAIEDTLATGGTSHDFRELIAGLADDAGWTGANPWHANMVFGQNAAMSFNAGNFVGMNDADIGHWMFRTYLHVDDQNPCEICEPLDGMIFSMDDRTYYPALHIGCRCYADPVFESELPKDGPSRSGDVVNEPYRKSQENKSAFKWDPAQFARVEPMDLGAVAPELRNAFAEYARDHGWATK